MAEKTASGASAGKWLPAVALAWILPGGGHALLKRPGRGGLIAFCVVTMYLLGLMMRGALFVPKTDDLLTIVITYGGFLGNLMSGILYFLTVWLGYCAKSISAGAAHDYRRRQIPGGGGLAECARHGGCV